MKIKITESQLNKIKLITEQDERMNTYQKFCESKAQEIDKIYSNVINQGVMDALNFTFKADEIIRQLDRIETEVAKAEKHMINLWDSNLMGDNDENFDLVINDIADLVTNKISSLTLILNPIEELQRLQNEHNLTKTFDNVKPLEIQSY